MIVSFYSLDHSSKCTCDTSALCLTEDQRTGDTHAVINGNMKVRVSLYTYERLIQQQTPKKEPYPSPWN